jgi:FkbM family methyltransferase
MIHLLEISARNDELWEIIGPLAIGNKAGEVNFNVSKNSVSSSTKTVLNAHTQAERDSESIEIISVRMDTLDETVRQYCEAGEGLALKIDVQGAEHEVLEGARTILNRTSVISCELSLVPLYEGQKLWTDMIAKFDELGFELCGLHRGFSCKRSGDTLQLEGLFRRK